MKKIMSIIAFVMVAAFALPAMAQWGNDNQVGATAPSTTFQSTSSMSGSNSAYSSNPSIGDNGMASQPNAVQQAPSSRGISNRHNLIENPDDNPIGDALWPLLMAAGAFLLMKALRRRRAE